MGSKSVGSHSAPKRSVRSSAAVDAEGCGPAPVGREIGGDLRGRERGDEPAVGMAELGHRPRSQVRMSVDEIAAGGSPPGTGLGLGPDMISGDALDRHGERMVVVAGG